MRLMSSLILLSSLLLSACGDKGDDDDDGTTDTDDTDGDGDG